MSDASRPPEVASTPSAADPLVGLVAVIHDLRQPLHALALNAQALRRRLAARAGDVESGNVAAPASGFDPELPPLADQIVAAAQWLEAQFDELLDQSRLQHAAVPVRSAPVVVGALYAQLRLQLGPLAFDRGLALRFRGGQHVLHADAALLLRILGNLVANALRHTDDGGVLVACRRQVAAGGTAWRLQVWDSGRGIAPALQTLAFEPFQQLDPARAGVGGGAAGVGLGLAICRQLATAMGAELSLCSRPGRGTVLTLAWTEPVGPTPPHTINAPRTG